MGHRYYLHSHVSGMVVSCCGVRFIFTQGRWLVDESVHGKTFGSTSVYYQQYGDANQRAKSLCILTKALNTRVMNASDL